MGLTANEEDIRIVSELVEDTRDAIIDYQVSRVVQNGFYGPLIKVTGLDCMPTGDIQSESQAYCESPKQMPCEYF